MHGRGQGLSYAYACDAFYSTYAYVTIHLYEYQVQVGRVGGSTHDRMYRVSGIWVSVSRALTLPVRVKTRSYPRVRFVRYEIPELQVF